MACGWVGDQISAMEGIDIDIVDRDLGIAHAVSSACGGISHASHSGP